MSERQYGGGGGGEFTAIRFQNFPSRIIEINYEFGYFPFTTFNGKGRIGDKVKVFNSSGRLVETITTNKSFVIP